MSKFDECRYGAHVTDDSVQWRVWAPRAKSVDLVLVDGERRLAHPMSAQSRGAFQIELPNRREGQRYLFRLDGNDFPDPCSLWQPDGVHAPSTVFHPGAFLWTDQNWHGIERRNLVFYELHVGTFTPEGTFDAILPRLASLRDLGVTAIELMPVAAFPGSRNWGYDGVYLYAVQESYGGPRGLQRLVDACHAHGVAVILDVVYNHLGPEGNYLGQFGPYFTNHYRTPWGEAFNYDGRGSDAVRKFVLDNARMWIEEFHVDGLRLDAVHAIYDMGAKHLLRELGDVVRRAVNRRPGISRQVHLIAESDMNDPRLLYPPLVGHGLDAEWSDDFHHAVHAYVTGERQGYYEDYGSAEHLARVFETPYLFAGEYCPRRDRRHGGPPLGLGNDRFVVAIQNHDQVGNRARGDRLATLVAPARLRLAASLLLLSPYLPLLFMGEEYGEDRPFAFFCSFGDPKLSDAVRQGRQREFAAFAWQGEVLDPADAATFDLSKVSWNWDTPQRTGLRRLYHDLLAARKNVSGSFVAALAPGPVLTLSRGPTSRAWFNLSDQPQPWRGDATDVWFRSEWPRYGGLRDDDDRAGPIAMIRPFECIASHVSAARETS